MTKRIAGGRVLAAARKAAGLTQEQLAKDLGVAKMTVSRIERNVQGSSDGLKIRWIERCGGAK
jgi:transcriptional regulator with XRE-family HTH domain